MRPLPEILADLDSTIRRVANHPFSKMEPGSSALAALRLNREALSAIHQCAALNREPT